MANSVEDYLIDGLSFKMKGGASYITDRRSVTFHPSGSNIYKPTGGTKLIKLNITGDSWLDPSTCRIMFDLRNNGKIVTVSGAPVEQILRPLGGPWGFFRRVRILCNGQIIEDIDSYNRCHELFSSLTAKDSRMNENAEGFRKSYDHLDKNPVEESFTPANYSGIKVNQSQTVLFKLLSGLLGGQTKYLPIRYASITIELELVDNMTDPVIKKI